MEIHWKEIDRIAKAHRRIDATSSEEAMLRELRLWWCIKYSRPFKDPLLDTYTLDELLYEYLTHFYLDPENDPDKKVEAEAQSSDDDDWVRKQIEEMNKARQANQKAPEIEKPKEIQESTPAPTPPIPELPELSTRFDE